MAPSQGDVMLNSKILIFHCARFLWKFEPCLPTRAVPWATRDKSRAKTSGGCRGCPLIVTRVINRQCCHVSPTLQRKNHRRSPQQSHQLLLEQNLFLLFPKQFQKQVFHRLCGSPPSRRWEQPRSTETDGRAAGMNKLPEAKLRSAAFQLVAEK